MNFVIDIHTLLCSLIREGLQIEKADSEYVVGLSSCQEVEWEKIYALASQQGVAAVAFDGLKRWMGFPELKEKFPKQVLFQWGASAMKVENLYARQWKSALLLSNLYHENNIRTVVLKGFAVAQYYPQPNHRACGDLDCFLFEDYEKGNQLVAQKGVKVDYDFYKHSEFDVKGLHVENHQFCTAIRGSRKAKEFERLLQRILRENELSGIGDSPLLCPPPMFNALFLTKHALGHFLSEGITLRHLCDWAMFVQRNFCNVEWPYFISICENFGLYPFLNILSALCEDLFHIKMPYEVKKDNRLVELVLDDIFNYADKREVSETNVWRRRIQLTCYVFRDRWKYKCFSTESFWHVALRQTVAHFWDKNPKI